MHTAIIYNFIFFYSFCLANAGELGYKVMGFKADNNGLISSVSIRLIMPASSKSIPSQIFLNPHAVINAGMPKFEIQKNEKSIVYNFELDVNLHLDEEPFILRGTPVWSLVDVKSTYTKIDSKQKFIPIIISSIHVLGIGFDWVADDKYIEEWFEKHAAKQ